MQTEKKILIVDDDKPILRLLTKYLTNAGFCTFSAENGAQARDVLKREKVDLMLLDVNMPGESGFEVARSVREELSDIGIIMLTGSGDVIDRVVGLEVGADDYVAKPFDDRELLARIRSLLRRISNKNKTKQDIEKMTFNGYTLDTEAQELLTSEGELVSLTSHEFLALVCLAKKAGRVLSRDCIMDEVFGRQWSPFDRSIDVLVGKLRKKLGDDRARLIKTIRGAGYKFTPTNDA